MGKGVLKFYMDSAVLDSDPLKGEAHRLVLRKTSDSKFVQHTVNMADRSDPTLPLPPGIVSRTLQTRNAAVFVSDPSKNSREFSGLFSGKLDFTVNKMDVDLTIALYELLPSGEYVQ